MGEQFLVATTAHQNANALDALLFVLHTSARSCTQNFYHTANHPEHCNGLKAVSEGDSTRVIFK